MFKNNPKYKKLVSKKLRIRQRLFFLIIAVLLIINIHNIVLGKIDIILGISGFLLSVLIGLLMSRIFKILWHPEKEQIISRLDAAGIILLIIYIGIELGRTWIFEHWLSGAALNAFGLIILSGLLYGRFLGTHLLIKKILEKRS